MSRHKKTALIGLLALLPALHACTSKEEAAQSYLREGKALLEQGNIEQARVQLKSAVQSNPKLADAYYRLALVDEKKQDWKAMYGNLLETVNLDKNHADAHFKLGLAYVAGRQLDKASEEAALLEKLQPGGVKAQALRGDILFLQGKKAEGIEELKQALGKEPSNYDTAVILSSLYLSDGNPAEALASLKQGIASHPQDIGLRLLKIQAEVDGKDLDAAIADYHALIEQNPDKKEFNYALVQLLMKFGKPEQAEAALRGVIDKNPADTDAKLALVGIISQRDAAEGEKALAKFAEENPKAIPIQSQLASFYASKQRYADAQAVLNRIIELDQNGRGGLAAKLELAKLAALQKDEKKAAALVEEVIAADSANPDALLMRAALHLDKREADAAIADLRVVLGANPRQDQALVMLAKAYQINGNAELAESNLRQALDINPGNLEAAVPVAAKLLKARELDRAEAILDAALKSHPDDPLALQLLAQARVFRSDWEGAQTLATQLGRQAKGSAAGHYVSGEIFAIQKNYDQAIKQFQAALQERPDFPEAIDALVQVYNAKGERAQLKAYFTAFIANHPKIIAGHIALAFSHAANKEWDEATRILQNALRTDPKSSPAYQALARVYQAQGKSAEDIEVYRKGLAELPSDEALMVGLGQAYERAKDSEAAIEVYRRTLQKDPNNSVAANNLASLLADYRTDKESLKEAAKLVEPFAILSNPNLLDTYGWVSLRAGDANKALPVLKRVVAAAPEVAVFRYHLGAAYQQAADPAAAKAELARALELAKKQGDFVGIDQARSLLKDLAQAPAKAKAPPD